MTDHDDFDAQLKASLERRAGQAPHTDLADAALLQAGRIRRRRRVATGIATLALAAVAVPIATEVAQRSSTPVGPATQGPGTTQQSSAEPQPSQSAAFETLEISGRPLLTDADVNPVGPYSGLELNSSQSLAQGYEDRACLPRLTTVDATRQQLGAWFSPEQPSFYEGVLQMPSVATARDLVDRQRNLPERCGYISETHRQKVDQPTPVEVEGADEALVWTVTNVPLPSDLGSEGSFSGVAMARRANVVVVVTFNAFADPTDGGWETYGTPALGLALDRALP